MNELAVPPLSIYAHMPWCVRKCPYCDFNSHVAPEAIPELRYVDQLLSDLDFDLPHVAGREIQSIFFGGGTPSLFSPAAIERFIAGVGRRLPLKADVEITLEANPGTIERGRFAGYREAGVTRISLGVQSFEDRQLKVLGRIHTASHIFDAVEEIRAACFTNFNLDLMYGLPEQSLQAAQADLAAAIALKPSHISHYQLTLEPGTVFFHKPPPLPSEDAIWEMQLACQSQLQGEHYEQYEVSAYARSDFRCRHNLNYWQFGDYLGLGAGAHGKWTDSKLGAVIRSERIKQPREYLAQSEPAARLVRNERVTAIQLPFEFTLNALRLNDGFDRELFEGRTGLSISAIKAAIENGMNRGLLTAITASSWRASSLGRQFLNDLQLLFLPDEQRLRSPTKTPVTA